MTFHFLKPFQFFDSAPVIDCAVIPIPVSSDLPLEVVASLSKTCQVIEYIDATAQFIGVYVGEAGFEELVAVIGGGIAKPLGCLIGKGNRVSLRSMGAVISSGALCIQFMGPTNE